MNETALPDSNAIADAMLKRTGEILREQVSCAQAPRTLAQKVIDTLKSLGAPGMMISGQQSLDAINELLKAAEAEKAKPGPVLRLASYFANEAPEGMTPRYAEVAEEFRGDPDVFPLYFAPSDSRVVEHPARP